MIDRKNFFDKPIKNDKITYENIRKLATGQGLNSLFIDYAYFKNS